MTIDLGLSLRLMAADCPTREDREESLWVARAKAGDEAGYRWLLARYRSRAVRLAAHVLRRDGEAEDVAQEAFMKAFRRLPSLGAEGRFSAWLFRIVVRTCLDRQRSARWEREAPPEAASPSLIPSEDTDTRLLVGALLDRLSPPMRAALVLREMEGLDYDEIALALGIPVGTVRSRLHSARAQFRQMWEAADAEEGGHHA